MLQSKEIQWMNEKTRNVYMILTRDSYPFYRNKLKMGGWKKVRSVQFRHSVISNSLWPHRLQHTRLPCTSPTPGGCWNSCPLIQWCHPTTSSSVVHFCWLQFFLGSWSFPWVSYLIIRWPKYCSFSFSISPSMSTQGWFPLGLTDLISLQSKGLSRVSSSTTIWKHQFFGAQPSLWSNSHIHTWLLEKP